MGSKEIGRRLFIKGASSAVLGLAVTPLCNMNLSFADAQKANSLEYRILGRTGLKVTAVSMGVMNCSDPSVLHRAFDLGINFYDTAHSYMGGRNEEMMGKAFRGKRDKVFIQTKFRVGTEKETRKSVETSLQRLQTDYVDVLLAHSLKKPDEVNDPALIRFLQAMKKEGKARFTGFSTHADMAPLLREAAKSSFHDVALTSYNFTHSNDLKEAVALARNSGIGIVAMKTQAGGYKASDMGGLSPHQAALKYVLLDQHVAVAVPGVTTIQQIEELAAVMGTALSRKDLDELRQYESHLQGRICTMCGGCIGECPHGVAHSDLLRAVMYRDGYKDDKLAREVLRTERALQQIKLCSDCSSCAITCSRGLDIHARLKEVHRMFS
ncbi:aldo/keto reductase [Desulfomonile tiedjei]|uniref:Putative oxidoreductase of aldo/keto reductase family n=1 Tax=Desulfomonile tiedjei (strain ATCC 49306 / DSM 6799 / DCB-1) TaxID=706587 RepID=I4C4U0_DESTA|nr:aldo/keto reductase [Desulfomonile tiedjei]AFM24581.1 putative oxidoreductase of aldo/keto reductase family [Desulfomonile tiedjei DSM 6799]